MKTVPYPDHWLAYKPLPNMKGKLLGVFAHVFVKHGAEEKIKEVYRKIVDVAIEEKTCIVLSGGQSLIDLKHNLLYEEWTDYEEFFQVQTGRTYRNGFMRWLDPIKLGPVSPEFTEIFHSTGNHPYNVAQNAFSLVQSVHVASEREDDAKKLFIQYVDSVGQDEKNLYANIHQSLNDPQHFLLYEVWTDLNHLIENELKCERRRELEASFNELKDSALPEPALEIFQIYYDPEKYDHSGGE